MARGRRPKTEQLDPMTTPEAKEMLKNSKPPRRATPDQIEQWAVEIAQDPANRDRMSAITLLAKMRGMLIERFENVKAPRGELIQQIRDALKIHVQRIQEEKNGLQGKEEGRGTEEVSGLPN